MPGAADELEKISTGQKKVGSMIQILYSLFSLVQEELSCLSLLAEENIFINFDFFMEHFPIYFSTIAKYKYLLHTCMVATNNYFHYRLAFDILFD